MAEVSDWSTVAANNNLLPPEGFPENMDYRQVNNSFRDVMSALARWEHDTSGKLASTGTASALELFPTRSHVANKEGDTYKFVATHGINPVATLRVGYAPAAGLYASNLIGVSVPAGRLVEVVFSAFPGTLGVWRHRILRAPQNYMEIFPGIVTPYAGATAPTGYLICDGAEYQTGAYPDLYAAIGMTYGGTMMEGASPTFNVPDLRGQLPVGAGGVSDTDLLASVGATGGLRDVFLNTTSMASHTHIDANMSRHNHAIIISIEAAHQHAINFSNANKPDTVTTTLRPDGGSPAANWPVSFKASSTSSNFITFDTASSGQHVHESDEWTQNSSGSEFSITGSSAGSGNSHNNVGPTTIVNWLIKT